MTDSHVSFNVLSDSELNSQKEIQFSRTFTVLCAIVCVVGLTLLLWGASSSEIVQNPEFMSRDLERLGSRLLSFESRLSELSTFEQTMFRLWGESSETQEQLRQWYAELPRERRSPLDELYVAILNGEANLRGNLRELMREWNRELAPFPVFRRLLDVGYLEKDQGNADYAILQAHLAEEVPGNWFYFQLATRLARQSGNESLREHLQRQFQQLTDPQLWKWRWLVVFECTLGAIGLICLVSVFVVWLRPKAVQATKSFNQRISPWTFHEGLAVLARGGALSIFLIVFLAIAPYGIMIVENYGSLLLYLPTVVLAVVLLCRPKNQSLLEVLGCSNVFQQFRSSLQVLFSVVALGLIGEWVIMLAGDVFETSVHWTEWFVPQLVWGSQGALLKTMIEFVVVAPIFEELIFRGMLFSTLRARFGFTTSMIGSALIFAFAHGYGLVGFLAVFWSGLLWAWTYERTGSLLPGICAHAINNGLVVSFLMAFFR